MEYKLEILKKIIELGAKYYPEITDPSKSEFLISVGVAPVTAHIEKLSLMGLIKDASPVFGENGGMWIGYSLSDEGYKSANDENLFQNYISKLQEKPTNEISNSVRELIALAKEKEINTNYKDDFITTLNEIAICFDNECYIATIALSGKILEVTLTEILRRNNINIGEKLMLGMLIRKIKERNILEYIDPALPEIAKVISYSRNGAIHYNEKIPIPSREQAIMVIFAMKDVVQRNLSK
jgi:hypothetical protein